MDTIYMKLLFCREGVGRYMGTDPDREIEAETTRVDAVRYLQGALGHATASLFFLLMAGLLWVGWSRLTAVVLVVGAFLLSANGLSMWAWKRLVAYFNARAARSDAEPTRTLRAEPLSTESTSEMKAGAAMTLAFVVAMVVGRLGLSVLEPRLLGYLSVGCLVVGNVVALVWSTRSR